MKIVIPVNKRDVEGIGLVVWEYRVLRGGEWEELRKIPKSNAVPVEIIGHYPTVSFRLVRKK